MGDRPPIIEVADSMTDDTKNRPPRETKVAETSGRVVLPLAAAIFLAVHFWRIRKDGGISGPL